MSNRSAVSRGLVPARTGGPRQVSWRSGWSLAVLLFALVLLPSFGWANTTKNCPVEPAQGVPIVSGETYFGTNCVLKTTGDVDSFTFTAAAGDTWSMFAGVGAAPASNICLSLFAPGSTGTPLFFGCTIAAGGIPSTGSTLKLTVAGGYTVVINEEVNGTTAYSLSLERINPPPTDATALTLATNVPGGVNFPTSQVAYTFSGATSGTYHIVASYAGGPDNVCFTVYQSGANVDGNHCTIAAGGIATVSTNVTPKVNGMFVIVLFATSNDSTVNFNLEVSCLLGSCPVTVPPPPTTCKPVLSYNATTATLTMKFTLATPVPATWNGWLVAQNTMQPLWSLSEPITEPAVTMPPIPQALPKSGKVGVLSTLTTPTKGITCSSWVMINTGTP